MIHEKKTISKLVSKSKNGNKKWWYKSKIIFKQIKVDIIDGEKNKPITIKKKQSS